MDIPNRQERFLLRWRLFLMNKRKLAQILRKLDYFSGMVTGTVDIGIIRYDMLLHGRIHSAKIIV